MRNIFGLLLALSLFSCTETNEMVLSYNTKPAETFIDIINHVFKNELAISNDTINTKRENSYFLKNKNDKELNKKIDKLFTFPIYKSLSEITFAQKDDEKYEKYEAYKIGFYDLSDLSVSMSGGVNHEWKRFWLKNNYSKSKEFLNKVVSQQTIVSKKAINAVSPFLPKAANTKDSIQVSFCFDNNRGSYTTDGMIVMDMFDFTNYDLNFFTNTLSHELHHIVYGNWITNNYDTSMMNDKQNTLLIYQKRILLEGIAQQINYVDYKKEIKDLYFNKELMISLSNDWFESIRGINSSQDPNEYYSTFKRNIWQKGNDRLKNYYEGKVDDLAYSRRPTVDYYISYHLYYSIKTNGGNERLEYVINHPENLLDEYNKLWNEDNLIPVIPNDITEIWKNNLMKK